VEVGPSVTTRWVKMAKRTILGAWRWLFGATCIEISNTTRFSGARCLFDYCVVANLLLSTEHRLTASKSTNLVN
jgi:hypothetical protein